MSRESVAHVREIYRHAVQAVTPEVVLPSVVRIGDNGSLTIGDRAYDITQREVNAIAVGKAAIRMAGQLEAILGERLSASIAVAKDPEPDFAGRTRVVLGSHPVPDQRSLDAGAEVLAFARTIPKHSLVICLISGGGSALMESLREGITLDELRETTSALLRAGASIHELNAVRSRMSELKAGGLLTALGHTEVVNLLISDVLGDDLSTIASGPTVPHDGTSHAEDVLRRYDMTVHLPESVPEVTPPAPYSLVVASLGHAVRAASDAATELGLLPVVLSSSLTGESRIVADALASIAADSAGGLTSFGAGTCFIAGGETTVTVHGEGRGGRNTEAALAAALRIEGVSGVTLGFLATDGDDAETGAAGGIVTGATVNATNRAAARSALDENDSFTFLSAAGSAWGDGPTGTNVNDLFIGIVD